MKILITGGGTGGHLAIAKSINEALLFLGATTYYIGSSFGQDREWFGQEEGFSQKWFFASKGVVDKRGLGRLRSLAQIARLSVQAKNIIQEYKIDAVFSVGGYSAAPASFAALLTSTPLFLHEQNARLGRLNKLLTPFAKRLFTSFAPPYDPYPVAQEFFATRRIRTAIKTIIFLGGSQGAKQINDIAIQNAPLLASQDISIIHQTGKSDYKRVKEAYRKMGIKADIFPFTKELAQKMAQADFAVSRAGASTLWELCANALPALFVPYPYAAANHQYHNAKFLVDKGAALLHPTHNLKNILSFDIEPMSRTLTTLIEPQGARYIAQTVAKMVQTT